MRKPFKKHLNDIVIEDAHGGSGKRQVILSKSDSISSQLDAMTKGFLAPNAKFDWHEHENIDEFFLGSERHRRNTIQRRHKNQIQKE